MAGKITRGLLAALEVTAAVFFILPMTGKGSIVNVGNCFGLAVMLACLGATILWQPLCRLLKRLWSKRRGKALLLSAGGILGLLVLYAFVLTGAMVSAAAERPESPDAVIVLGCRVSANGNPSLMLSRRIEAAYGYLSDDPDLICIAAGGQGADEPFSEAQVIRDKLVEMGIEEQRILLEDKSVNTRENIELSLELLSENGIDTKSMTIVTDGFHQLRAALIAKKMGVNASAVNAVTPFWLVPTYWVREWFALSYLFVFR